MNTNTATTKPVTATAPVASTKVPKAPKAEKPVAEVKEAAPVVKYELVEIPEGVSKKAMALPVIEADIEAKVARKDTLLKIEGMFGLSAAGANTYYQNVKSGAWSSEKDAARAEADKVKEADKAAKLEAATKEKAAKAEKAAADKAAKEAASAAEKLAKAEKAAADAKEKADKAAEAAKPAAEVAPVDGSAETK